MCNLQRRLRALVEHAERVADIQHRKGLYDHARTTQSQATSLRQIVDDLYGCDGPQAGNIGKPIRHVELPGEEPLTVPDFDPEDVPVEEPAVAPVEPEHIPA